MVQAKRDHVLCSLGPSTFMAAEVLLPSGSLLTKAVTVCKSLGGCVPGVCTPNHPPKHPPSPTIRVILGKFLALFPPRESTRVKSQHLREPWVCSVTDRLQASPPGARPAQVPRQGSSMRNKYVPMCLLTSREVLTQVIVIHKRMYVHLYV